MDDSDSVRMGGPVRLVPFTQSSPQLEEALRVYAQVWPDRDQAVAREGFTRYAGYNGFYGLVARDGDTAVAVGYGARSVPGIWWHDQVTPILGTDHPALHDAWRLVELAVVAPHRQRGIGGQVHDALLAAQPCPRVLLCTAVGNTRARAMYERRGWHYIARTFAFPGEPHPYAIMGKELGRPGPVHDR
jgi:ribosomal protein S18 acetylase RimI-like enzyme